MKLKDASNPFASYYMGILHAMSNIEEKPSIEKFACNPSGYNHFDMDQQFELIECNYFTGTIVLKSKHTNFFKRICIADFKENIFILYAISVENAYTIGYFITEYSIDNKEK